MELTAVVLAVRMNGVLKAELQLNLENSVFWTDSTSTLKYIQNKNKKFKTFVANRVNTNREMTNIKQWRHINTKQNPADCASHGLKASTLLNSHTWLTGPEFLKDNESEWPRSDSVLQTCDEDDDAEVRKDALIMNVLVKPQHSPTHEFIHYHSKWKKLTSAVAWLLKLKDALVHLSQKRKEILFCSIKNSDTEKPYIVGRKMQTVKKCMNVQPLTVSYMTSKEQRKQS